MIELLAGGMSFLTSAAGGSFVKLISGTISDVFKLKRENAQAKTDRKIAEQRGDVAAYRSVLMAGGSGDPTRAFVLWTRRLLALSVTWTMCFVTILWAHNPTGKITTFKLEKAGNFTLLWGLVAFPVEAGTTVDLSNGAVVWGIMNLLGFIMGLYFTPSGKQ